MKDEKKKEQREEQLYIEQRNKADQDFITKEALRLMKAKKEKKEDHHGPGNFHH